MSGSSMQGVFAALLLLCAGMSRPSHAAEERVVLESNGWRLVGEWRSAPRGEVAPAALLLHRAAGSREEYAALSDALAERGVASLRLDLRGHGGSDNLGRFEAPCAEHRGVIERTYEDVDAALRWMTAQPGVAPNRLAAVGASYSGEAIGEALRRGGERAAAYVILSPGSFSDESIAEVDASGAPCRPVNLSRRESARGSLASEAAFPDSFPRRAG